MARNFTDQMTSTTLERPGLQRALLEARNGGFDLLLVYRVDRLYRSVRGLAQVLDELDRAKVVFRSATEPFDTGSPAEGMMVQMLGVFAEFERATIVDRVIAGMKRKAARGGWNGGQLPFGYRRDPETRPNCCTGARATLSHLVLTPATRCSRAAKRPPLAGSPENLSKRIAWASGDGVVMLRR